MMGIIDKCGVHRDATLCIVIFSHIVTLKVDISSDYEWISANLTHLRLLINKIYKASYLKMC